MNYIIENINTYSDEDYLKIYQKINLQKKEKIDKLKKTADKKRSLLGEYCLIKLLKKYYNIDYKKTNFYTNEYGKPYIQDSNIFFNISHSNDYVIVAISNKEIGIDIEKIRDTNINTINQFATLKEKEYILSDSNNCFSRLFEIYTLKESYIKMKGKNMNEVKNIEFRIKDNLTFCSDSSINTLLFKNIKKGYIISICEKK